jgi:hypothetical protein
MKSLTEIQSAANDIQDDDRVIIHVQEGEHEDGPECWCKPLVMTGYEFKKAQFDQ